jgi:hypothetical protein
MNSWLDTMPVRVATSCSDTPCDARWSRIICTVMVTTVDTSAPAADVLGFPASQYFTTLSSLVSCACRLDEVLSYWVPHGGSTVEQYRTAVQQQLGKAPA